MVNRNIWGNSPNNSGGGNNTGNDNDEFERLLRKGKSEFRKMFSGNGGSKNGGKKIIAVFVAILFFVWISTGFRVVEPDESGVVLRFGKYSRTANNGLNYIFPNPIEKMIKVKVSTINKEDIGFRSSLSRGGEIVQKSINEESLMLTGDENIVNINFSVYWRIKDPVAYLFNVYDTPGESTIRFASESVTREVIGRSVSSDIFTVGKEKISFETKELLQSILDSYNIGIEVVNVKMLKMEAPDKVIDAFRDVQTAKADRERLINQAEAYRNDILPKARGESERIIQKANAYENEVVANAQGQSNRFLSVYAQYVNAKDVTLKRMYLESMENILKNMNKIIIDEGAKSSGVVPYMPLPGLAKKLND